jgi:hypothetical protein
MLSTVGETAEADTSTTAATAAIATVTMTPPARSPKVEEEAEEEEEEEGMVREEEGEMEDMEEVGEEEEEDKEVKRIFRMADDPQYSEAVAKTRNHSISVMESAAEKGKEEECKYIIFLVMYCVSQQPMRTYMKRREAIC